MGEVGDRTRRSWGRYLAWLMLCLILVAVGGSLSGLLALVGMNVYVSVFDPRPESSYGYQDPMSGILTFYTTTAVSFAAGAIVTCAAIFYVRRAWKRP